MSTQNSGFSAIGIASALCSFLSVFLTYDVAGLILGLVAVALGGAGFYLAISYHLSDRRPSLASMILGMVSALFALIVLLF